MGIANLENSGDFGLWSGGLGFGRGVWRNLREEDEKREGRRGYEVSLDVGRLGFGWSA